MNKKKSFLYKIAFRFKYAVISLAIIVILPCKLQAQDSSKNKYGLYIIENESAYEKSIINQPDKMMVDLETSVPGIEFDLRYASRNNFMHEKIYSRINRTYMRLRAVIAIAGAQRELNEKKLGLLIWDAYRPYSVTEKMWDKVKDARYAADPKTGSGHNRGVAVDLTIIDSTTKLPLNMGTDFDNFSDSAHQDFKFLPPAVLKNRTLLRTTMEKYGFKALETEWWHFYLPESSSFELMDLSFKTLAKITRQK